MLCFVKVHYRPQKQKVKDFSLFLCKYIVHDIYAFFPAKKAAPVKDRSIHTQI